MKILPSDAERRSFNGERLPLFVYSYASRGFPDLIDRLKCTLPYVPSYLLSLYDYEDIPSELVSADDRRLRIWDSGGYETIVCSTCRNAANTKKWDEKSYTYTANQIPWNGRDVLVSYDTPSEPRCIQHQVETALNLYNKVKGTYVKNLLIHVPEYTNPCILAEILRPYLNEFQILGVTEKEIAPTWVHGVHFINRLRLALSALGAEQYIPIHVFGCFDSKTIARFTLAGADIFDGLTWMRYLFLNGNVLYQRELEYTLPIDQILTANLGLSMMLHNVSEMEQLRSNLIYAIHTNDMAEFEREISDLSKAFSAFNEQEEN